MNGKTLARLLAIVFVAIAITATAIEMVRDDTSLDRSRPAASTNEDTRADPLRRTLRQCREMGEAATRDAGCRDAWAESRERFLGRPDGR